MERSSFDALIQVVRALQTCQVPYMLVGAFSSNAYGYPRATKDADIVIQYREGLLATVCTLLGEDFWFDPQAGFKLKTGSIRNIVTYIPTKFEIEFFSARARRARPRKICAPT